MPPATLAEWLARIERLHPRSIELGLERVGAVYAALRLPRAPTVVTVAGTNGKGSLVALTEAILCAAGYRVGAYTSPHVVRFNERVRVAGEAVADAALCASFAAVDACRGDIPLTYFEFTTLAALHRFAAAPLDAWLLEVGLGGRLDAVNAVDPDLALVGPIDLDHADWLGDDRESIGREKAGILRPGIPAVTVDAAPPRSLVARAAELGVTLYRPGGDYRHAMDAHGWHWACASRRRDSLPRPALAGRHQLANAAAVLTALDCLRERLPVGQGAVRTGLREVTLPGRFQVLPGAVEVVLDVAHNPQAARALAETLRARPAGGRTLAVVGMLGDKPAAATVAPLLALVDGWFVAPLADRRGDDGGRVAAALARAGTSLARCTSVADAVAAARAAARPGDRVLVFGSFLTVAEALAGAL